MKKRILSLILALSMVLSVLPLWAFAEGPLPELVMGAGGYPVCPDGTTGDGWEYKGGTLILKSGSYDFNYFYPKTNGGGVTEQTVHCGIKLEQDATITGGDFGANVTNDKGTISGGFFADGVTNSGTITGNGTFAGEVKNITGGTIPGGTISGGTFYGSVTNLNTIEKGTFEGNVTNSGTISGGTFQSKCSVENYSYIENGTFEGSVTNYSYIENGTFNGSVTNDGTNATIKNGTFGGTVENSGTIENGIFNGTVENFVGTISGGTFAGSVTNKGTITSGTFNGKVKNYRGRTISGGTFKGTVNNDYGTISGGTFAAGLSKNNGSKILGGIFNGNANLTGAYHVTVTDGSVSQVNGEGPLNADGTPGTAWDLYAYADTTMTITANTEIFSLNGQPINESSYGSDKTIVTFTMPDKDVVLNGAITCTDLVMEKGWPKASNEGKISCSGTGWEYIKKSSGSTNTGTLYLMSGSEPFDFNFADPATKITRTDAAVKCAIESYGTISGGIFDGTVTNNAGGEISDGTFKGDVENSGYIEKGTFNGEVTNNTSGTIFGGTFRGQVDNNGKITGGIFAAGLSTTPGTVTGGIFNGNTGLTGAHQVTVTNGSVSTVNDEGPRNADGTWDLYSYKDTTMTIIASTEIFSLNGKSIGDGNCNSSYGVDKKTVTFTMPDDDVVLNGELITKPEPEPEPEPKPEPEPEPTTYTVTVIGGTIDGKTSVSAKENDTLTVVLDQNDIPDGMTFDMWSISSSKLSGDINVDYRAEAMTFQMPAENVTIRAQYRSAEIIEDAAPSPLATAATIAVGGAAAGIVVWQGVNLGVDLYLANALPQGVPVPTDRRALALLLWETAGKPEVALPTLYGDIPAEEIELQKATRWAVQNGLMDAADKKDASFFDPDHYVTKMDVFGAWLRLKKLLGTT